MPIYLCSPGTSRDKSWDYGIQVYATPFPLSTEEIQRTIQQMVDGRTKDLRAGILVPISTSTTTTATSTTTSNDTSTSTGSTMKTTNRTRIVEGVEGDLLEQHGLEDAGDDISTTATYHARRRRHHHIPQIPQYHQHDTTNINTMNNNMNPPPVTPPPTSSNAATTATSSSTPKTSNTTTLPQQQEQSLGVQVPSLLSSTTLPLVVPVPIRRIRHSEIVLVDDVCIAYNRYWLRLRWPGTSSGGAGTGTAPTSTTTIPSSKHPHHHGHFAGYIAMGTYGNNTTTSLTQRCYPIFHQNDPNNNNNNNNTTSEDAIEDTTAIMTGTLTIFVSVLVLVSGSVKFYFTQFSNHLPFLDDNRGDYESRRRRCTIRRRQY
jgi:hypothetical protein